MSLNNAYVRHLQPAEFRRLSKRDGVGRGSISRPKSNRNGAAMPSGVFPRPAKIYGFATWWKVELVPGIGFSTGPLSPRTHWEQLYFPLLAPIEASPSDVVSIDLRSSSSEEGGTDLAWTAVHKSPEGKVIARQALELDKGYIP